MTLALLLSAAAVQQTPPATPSAHDRDPWVFRCVLDNNPRMLIVSLGDRWWMAFDTSHCSVYKIWQGTIELTGAVYDTKHGPQPKAVGTMLLDGTVPIRVRTASPNAPESSPTRWQGYTLEGDRVRLRWQQGDVSFTLVPAREGSTLTLAVESDAADRDAAAITLPTALAPASDSQSKSSETRATTDIALPESGDITLKIDLARDAKPMQSEEAK